MGFNDGRYFGYGSGIAVKKGNPEPGDRLNQAIARLRQDGSYQQVQAKYFSFDVYGQ